MFFLSFDELVQDCDRLDRVLTIPHEISDETVLVLHLVLAKGDATLCLGQVIQSICRSMLEL
jgi:hypothetical protein